MHTRPTREEVGRFCHNNFLCLIALANCLFVYFTLSEIICNWLIFSHGRMVINVTQVLSLSLLGMMWAWAYDRITVTRNFLVTLDRIVGLLKKTWNSSSHLWVVGFWIWTQTFVWVLKLRFNWYFNFSFNWEKSSWKRTKNNCGFESCLNRSFLKWPFS